MKRSHIYLGMFLSALIGALVASFVVIRFAGPLQNAGYNSISDRQQQIQLTGMMDSSLIDYGGLNFTFASNKVIPAVVHIRTLYSSGRYSINPMNNYYRSPSRSSGSGVIISDDGYIVTNNHVIEDARQIEVVLFDNRRYMAEIIGTDPTTDLALLKIDEDDLTFVPYGNSDEVYPGEWVLAIGNPFDLNSTVTAGIVSAKARNIRILRDRNNLQIESFIQTDAAVNPGNSGGALVNLRGELVGINTAIATPNGSYAGYSFAVPVALVRKVMDDLLEYGEVQRGLLGIRINDVNAQFAAERDLEVVSGVFVSMVNENSAALDAGIESGDVITAINGTTVKNVSELQELVARNRPGDEIEVTYIRNGDVLQTMATLKDFEGNSTIKAPELRNEISGAVFEELSESDLMKYEIDGGVKIVSIEDGPWKDAGVESGFIVTRIDKIKIDDLADLNRNLENKSGAFLLEGIYENGDIGIFGVTW